MNCPICFSRKVFLFHDKVWSIRDGSVYQCKNCGISFIDPVMSDEEEKGFYKKYSQHIKLRSKTTAYSMTKFHYLSKIVALERYNFIKDYLNNVKLILEIGSATGAFLEVLNENNYEKRKLSAVEPFLPNRKHCKKFAANVYQDLSEVKRGSRFDMICAFHTFEHLRNPFDVLKTCKSHLTKDGMVLVEVPCINDPLISLYDCRSFKDFYFQPMHPYVYSCNALRYVFSKSGFSEKKVVYYQRYGLDNHLTWLSKGTSGSDELLKSLFKDDYLYKDSLCKAKKTDTLFYIATC